MEEEIQVRLTLKGKLAEQFRALKDYTGLKNNSEVLRFLVKREHDKIMASEEWERNV